MTSIQIIIHEKLHAIQCFCGFVGRNHQCEKTKQFMEKLSFERVLTNVQNAVIELREMNIRKIGGQQIEMDIWFVGDATKNFLKKFVQTVFVKFVIKLLMNTVTVILNNFF